MGGKSSAAGSASSSYDYFGTIAGVICNGVTDNLYSLVVDWAEVWPRAQAWAVGQVIGAGALRSYNGQAWQCKAGAGHTATTGNAPPDPTKWDSFSLVRTTNAYDDISVTDYGIFRIYWGTSAQVQEPLLSAAGNNFGEDHPAYKDVCYGVLIDWKFGRERISAPSVEVVVGRKPNQSIITGSAANLSDGQANLVATAAEFLTSPNCAGLSPSIIDTPTFQNAADYLDGKAALAAASPLLDSQESLQSILSELSQICDAHFFFDPAIGKIKAVAFKHGETPTAFQLTIDDLTERPQPESEGWSQASTRAVVSFSDRTRGYKKSSDKYDDLRMFAIAQEHRPMSLNRPWITRWSQAVAHGAETLRTLGVPQTEMPISVRREKARQIAPGVYVTVDIDPEPGGTQLIQYFRVVQRTTTPLGAIKFHLEAEEAIPPIVYNPGDPPLLHADEVVPVITHQRIIDPTATLSDSTSSVLILAERPDKLIIGAGVFFDTNTSGTFQRLGDISGFAMRATLRSDITDSATTIPITVPAQADSDRVTEQPGALQANDDFLIAVLVDIDTGQVDEDGNGYQIVEFASISAQALVSGSNYDLTVLRGRLGTSGKAFDDATTEVWILPLTSLIPFDHADLLKLRQNKAAGTTPITGYFRLTPRTFSAELELHLASSIPYDVPSKRAAAPALTLTAPAAEPVGVSTYPSLVSVTGDWSDTDSDLTGWKISRILSGVESLVAEESFAPKAFSSFSVPVAIDAPGTYTILLRAFDYLGNITTREIIANATGSGGKADKPVLLWNGVRVPGSGTDLYGVGGPVELRCGTTGATIKWQMKAYTGATLNFTYGFNDYDFLTGAFYGTGTPSTPWIPNIHGAGSPTRITLEFYAVKAGLSDSDHTTLTFF